MRCLELPIFYRCVNRCAFCSNTAQMAAFGGHLFSAKAGATCELSIVPGQRKLTRRPDRLTGLKLLHLTT